MYLFTRPPTGHQQPVYKALSGEGPLDRVMCELVEENGAGLVALQLPPGTKSLPQQLMQLMRSNRGGPSGSPGTEPWEILAVDVLL
jgi:hypothetical protein